MAQYTRFWVLPKNRAPPRIPPNTTLLFYRPPKNRAPPHIPPNPPTPASGGERTVKPSSRRTLLHRSAGFNREPLVAISSSYFSLRNTLFHRSAGSDCSWKYPLAIVSALTNECLTVQHARRAYWRQESRFGTIGGLCCPFRPRATNPACQPSPPPAAPPPPHFPLPAPLGCCLPPPPPCRPTASLAPDPKPAKVFVFLFAHRRLPFLCHFPPSSPLSAACHPCAPLPPFLPPNLLPGSGTQTSSRLPSRPSSPPRSESQTRKNFTFFVSLLPSTPPPPPTSSRAPDPKLAKLASELSTHADGSFFVSLLPSSPSRLPATPAPPPHPQPPPWLRLFGRGYFFFVISRFQPLSAACHPSPLAARSGSKTRKSLLFSEFQTQRRLPPLSAACHLPPPPAAAPPRNSPQ